METQEIYKGVGFVEFCTKKEKFAEKSVFFSMLIINNAKSQITEMPREFDLEFCFNIQICLS